MNDLRKKLRESSVGALLLDLDRSRDREDSHELRRRICFELGQRKSVEAVPRLREALRDQHPRVRAAAAEALGNIGEKAAGEDLVELLFEESQPVQVRDTAAYALARLRFRPAVFSLLMALSDPAPSVRMCAAAGLLVLGTPAVRDHLERAKSIEKNSDVREALEKTLREIPEPNWGKIRDLWLARRTNEWCGATPIRRLRTDFPGTVSPEASRLPRNLGSTVRRIDVETESGIELSNDVESARP